MTRVETIGAATLYLGDCLEILPTIGKVDAVVTDPPFEAEAHALQRRAKRGQSMSTDPLSFEALTPEQRVFVAKWAAEHCAGWFLGFCQAEAVTLWREALQDGGASYKRSMVWVKPDGMPQYSGDRPGMGYESIVAAWCSGGRSSWNGGGRVGVFTHNKNSGGKHVHETQKPLPLMQELIDLFTDAGNTVLDPFMGSATTGVACVNLGRRFIGIERREDYFSIARRRIEEAYKQPRLFAEPAPKPTQVELL